MGRDAVKRARKELLNAGLLEMRRLQETSGVFRRVHYRVSRKILASRHSTENQSSGKAAGDNAGEQAVDHSTEKPLYGKPGDGLSVR